PVPLDGVAGAGLGDVGTQRGGVDVVEDVHGSFALCTRHRSNAGIKKVGVRRASRSHGSPVAGPCGSTRSNSATPRASPATPAVTDRPSAIGGRLVPAGLGGGAGAAEDVLRRQLAFVAGPVDRGALVGLRQVAEAVDGHELELVG